MRGEGWMQDVSIWRCAKFGHTKNTSLPDVPNQNTQEQVRRHLTPVEMPKKYVNDQRWGALGAELAGKVTKNYGTEISGKIDREIATEVKNKIERYTKTIITNAHKYEHGIKGIPELKKLNDIDTF